MFFSILLLTFSCNFRCKYHKEREREREKLNSYGKRWFKAYMILKNLEMSNFHHVVGFIDCITYGIVNYKFWCKNAVELRFDLSLKLMYILPFLRHSIHAKNTQKTAKNTKWTARLVFKANRREHTTPHLKELHWLPVCERINYKLHRLHTKVNMQQLHLIYKTS